ncbi:DUF1045 domain-containing protein [Yoonia sp. SS1-5]|uniref:DUF1045 domain-containing protein n=1 Tax=Yoonia rhodophyticola TaxID=3137370 RepID=A0AAN0MES4_9RHOB
MSCAFFKEDGETGEFMSYSRFAIYYVPPEGPLATFGATWLGWDILRGATMPQFNVPGLDDITMTPRKYGFHGTLKPPFHLKPGQTQAALETAVAAMASRIAPAICDGLRLTPLSRFLALTPYGALGQLQQVAEACVRELDDFRAPASASELTKRRAAGLTERQDALLTRWGYPYVMEEFRFHLTLTGKLPEDAVPHWTTVVVRDLPKLPRPFVVNQIALCGERRDGRFELIHRYTLAG